MRSHFILVTLVVSGCMTEPVQIGSYEGAVISDAVHGGTAGFYWLPPLVPAPSPAGVFEPAAQPTVEVVHGSTLLRTLPVSLGTDQFHANWDTKADDLSSSLTYRVQVRVPDGRIIGFADIDVVDTGAQVKTVNTSQYVPLVDGRTLPVKFRIEHATVDADGDGVLDWNDNCRTVANADQTDTLGDDVGDACRCAQLTCAASDACHVATCTPTSGCGEDVADDGTACDVGSSCRAGVCTPDRCETPFALSSVATYTTPDDRANVVRAGDFNSDGAIDLAVGEDRAYVTLFTNTGSGTLTQSSTYANNYVTYLSVGDVNGDGNLDAVATNYIIKELNVLLGNGNGTLQARITIPTCGHCPPTEGAGSVSGELGDVDNDGDLDLAVGYSDGRLDILHNNGAGSFTFGYFLDLASASGRPVATRFGDVDGDGDRDLVVANQDGIVVLRNDAGTLVRHAGSNYNGSQIVNYPSSLDLADVNGDAKLDIVAGSTAGGGVTVLVGNGAGSFTSTATVVLGRWVLGVAAADFDGDGNVDVAATAWDSAPVALLLGNGDGTLTAGPGVAVPPTSQTAGVVAADLDGDGHSDLGITARPGKLHVAINTCQ